MFSEKALRVAAEELNEVLGLDPAIPVKKAGVDALTEKIKEALELIDPSEDEFTEATQAILDELAEKEDEDEEEEEKPVKKGKGKKAPVEEDEDENEDEEDDDEEEDEEAQEKANKLHKKNIGKKPVNAGKKAPVEDEEEEDEDDEEEEEVKKPAKKKGKGSPIKSAGGDGKPGIIQTIVGLVEKAGKKGISKKEILAQLKEDFPDRNEVSMKNTINVQVPARINKEKFPVKKVGEDRYTKA